LSEDKPLRWSSLLTIPIVAAAIWGVMLAWAHVERAELIEVLTARISNGDVNEATVALGQIVRMPDPPLEVLVAAAASPTKQVARRAQSSISELLRKWQRQLNANRRVRRVAQQLELLIALLDVEQESFSTRDNPWLTKTTESIVRLANAAPPRDALGLAVHCESLLSRANAHTFGSLAAITPVTSTAVELAPDSVFNPPARIAIQSIIPDEGESREGNLAPESLTPATDDAQPELPLDWSQRDETESSEVPLPPLFYRRHRAEADAASPIPKIVAAPVEPRVIDPWAGIETRALFDRWLAANGTAKLQVAWELERRGFGSLRADVVRLAVSDDTNGRIQLVQDLLDLPGTGTKAWLLFFAHDANAEVRFAAVTIMATSNDAELLEAAWQVTLHDRDPRVAALANRLRERRDGTRQR
jgi:hypothetical protein